MAHIRCTNPRQARKLWRERGGHIVYVRRTGEERWEHPSFSDTVRVNIRRHDVPAVILCRLNKLINLGKPVGRA